MVSSGRSEHFSYVRLPTSSPTPPRTRTARCPRTKPFDAVPCSMHACCKIKQDYESAAFGLQQPSAFSSPPQTFPVSSCLSCLATISPCLSPQRSAADSVLPVFLINSPRLQSYNHRGETMALRSSYSASHPHSTPPSSV